jgi:hypothetical protein
MQCSAFIFREGSQNAGQLGTNVNAVLDSIRWVKVEGEKVYQAPKQQTQEPAQEPAANSADDSEATPSEPEPDDGSEGFASSFDHAYGFGDVDDDRIPF